VLTGGEKLGSHTLTRWGPQNNVNKKVTFWLRRGQEERKMRITPKRKGGKGKKRGKRLIAGGVRRTARGEKKDWVSEASGGG